MKHATHCWFTRVQYLVLTLFLSVGLSLIAGTVMAQEPKVTSLMSKDLKDIPWQGTSDDHSGACARRVEP